MRYYCIKQHDITDCGVACLATICKQNGYKIGIKVGGSYINGSFFEIGDYDVEYSNMNNGLIVYTFKKKKKSR